MQNTIQESFKPIITIGLNIKDPNFDYSIQELNNLALANNMKVVNTLVQKADHRDAATYFGKGKVEELAQLVQATGVDTVVVNDELSFSQIRNLEHRTRATIIDRTGLILEIFSNRAQTHEAKLQVQLARYQYQLPRLHTSASQRLDQQTGAGGGGFTSRGSGESQLELNRRVIQKHITHIKAELKQIAKSDQTKNKRRQKKAFPTVGLVGYTNAGKSTLTNALIQRYGVKESKTVAAKNMLFATLDTSVRKLIFPDHKQLMISDTVGFVSRLPHQLVDAFRSTLSVAKNADLLVQVVDDSDPDRQLMIDTTNQTLDEIGVTGIPMITVYNKADLTNDHYPLREGNNLIISAHDERSIDELVKLIREKVFKNYVTKTFLIPFAQGQLVNQLNQEGNVLETSYQDNGTKIKAELSAIVLPRFEKYVL